MKSLILKFDGLNQQITTDVNSPSVHIRTTMVTAQHHNIQIFNLILQFLLISNWHKFLQIECEFLLSYNLHSDPFLLF